jgi:DNA polymerase-1
MARASTTRKKAAVEKAKVAPAGCVLPTPADHRFLRGFTDEQKAALAAAREVVIDFETTGLSPWAKPLAPTGKIGGAYTVQQYCTEYGTTMDATVRPRILSVGLPETGAVAVFDLDCLATEDKLDLLAACINGKVILGHNVQFDLSWAKSIMPDLHPERIIDTMILARTHLPQGEILLRKRLAHGSLSIEMGRAVNALVIAADAHGGKKGRFGSLASVSLICGLPKPDKSHQKPVNWMPAALSDGHYDYCAGDVVAPAIIARRIVALADPSCPTQGVLKGRFDGMTTAGLLHKIDTLPGSTAYRIAESAMPVLIQMQHNGMRLDPRATDNYCNTQRAAAAKIYDGKLATIQALSSPEMRGAILTTGEPDSLKNALDMAVGGQLPRTEAGKVSLASDALVMAGLSGNPILSAYTEIQGLLKRADMMSAYLADADENSRIHPSVTILAATLRTTSQNPNLQNVPRDPVVRELFKAAPGHKMIAADYSAVELRIAAALTARCYDYFVDILNSVAPWGHIYWLRERIIERIVSGKVEVTARHLFEKTEDRNSVTLDDWAEYYADAMAVPFNKIRLQNDGVLIMRKAFRDGADLHLATAIYLLAVRGEFDLGGKNPIDFLAALSHEEQEELKKKYKKQRQAAKACNFGLLYGMQSETLHAYGKTGYGLSWEMPEAEASYKAWHELYPEIGFWQTYTQLASKFVDKAGNNKHDLVTAKKGYPELQTNRKVYRATTLSGRPIVSAKINDALNFQDQGTGAEIALLALGRLPEHLQKCLVLFVHDEIVLEVPEEKAEQYKNELEQVMLTAGDDYFREFGVPCEVEGEISDSWKH